MGHVQTVKSEANIKILSIQSGLELPYVFEERSKFPF